MKTLFLAAFFLAPLSVFASDEPTVNCDIETLADAQACMEKVAVAYPEYEEANQGLATENTAGLEKLMNIFEWEEGVDQAKRADFAGLMMEHGDEHHIYYFAMNRGKGQPVVQVYDLNVVDLPYILEAPFSEDEMNPDTYFLGLDGRAIDGYSDVAEHLEYAKKEAENNGK